MSISDNVLVLYDDQQELVFHFIALRFLDTIEATPFAKKNNLSVGETIERPKYTSLATEVRLRYPASLNEPLGTFLVSLKSAEDALYRRFLNPYGDEEFCRFRIADTKVCRQRGLYLFTVAGEVKYIGRCRDSFEKRINQGYGTIHPKNCYRDGQATNCHLNALASRHREQLAFSACPLEDPVAIEVWERALIRKYQPEWNIQLSGATRAGHC